jgi:hypothetical protein
VLLLRGWPRRWRARVCPAAPAHHLAQLPTTHLPLLRTCTGKEPLPAVPLLPVPGDARTRGPCVWRLGSTGAGAHACGLGVRCVSLKLGDRAQLGTIGHLQRALPTAAATGSSGQARCASEDGLAAAALPPWGTKTRTQHAGARGMYARTHPNSHSAAHPHRTRARLMEARRCSWPTTRWVQPAAQRRPLPAHCGSHSRALPRCPRRRRRRSSCAYPGQVPKSLCLLHTTRSPAGTLEGSKRS